MNSLFPDQSPLDSIINRSARPPCKVVEAREEFYCSADGDVFRTMDRGLTMAYITDETDVLHKGQSGYPGDFKKMDPIVDDRIYFSRAARCELTHFCIINDDFFALDVNGAIHWERCITWLTPDQYSNEIAGNKQNGDKTYTTEARMGTFTVSSSGVITSIYNDNEELDPRHFDTLVEVEEEAQGSLFIDDTKGLVFDWDKNIGSIRRNLNYIAAPIDVPDSLKIKMQDFADKGYLKP